MTLIRKLMVGVAATGLTLSALAVVSAGPAWAKATVGTGQFTCNTSTGTVQFSPAWSDTGTGKVRATVNIAFSDCGIMTVGGPAVSSAQLTGHLKFANGGGACTSGAPSIAGYLHLTYSNGAKRSKFHVEPGSNIGGGTLQLTVGTVTGSYPSTDPIAVSFGSNSGNCTTGVQAFDVSGNALVVNL